MIIPMPIFLGVEGSWFRLRSQVKIPITGKVNETIKSGLKDWNTSGAMGFLGPQPETSHQVTAPSTKNMPRPISLITRFLLKSMTTPATVPMKASMDPRLKKILVKGPTSLTV
ncbi:MAG: hypothetical protein BWX87_01326 [Bacteroidetes bacterium ADurb.Bin123]|nr:MAG: hypothetical protein BWX87_01326 [Bacteroidetes bacterium ADurb.Bin123]